jgi:hypothetical protein
MLSYSPVIEGDDHGDVKVDYFDLFLVLRHNEQWGYIAGKADGIRSASYHRSASRDLMQVISHDQLSMRVMQTGFLGKNMTWNLQGRKPSKAITTSS